MAKLIREYDDQYNHILGYDDVPTKASKLVESYNGTETKVSFIYDEDEETISVIYVLAYPDLDA